MTGNYRATTGMGGTHDVVTPAGEWPTETVELIPAGAWVEVTMANGSPPWTGQVTTAELRRFPDRTDIAYCVNGPANGDGSWWSADRLTRIEAPA
jgi:hypothetical protein